MVGRTKPRMRAGPKEPKSKVNQIESVEDAPNKRVLREAVIANGEAKREEKIADAQKVKPVAKAQAKPKPKAKANSQTKKTGDKDKAKPKAAQETVENGEAAPKPKKNRKVANNGNRKSHSKIGDMIDKAILQLGDRQGSSSFAIKKFIRANWDENIDKKTVFIKKYLKAAVENGLILQKTHGAFTAGGTFRLSTKHPKHVPSKRAPKQAA